MRHLFRKSGGKDWEDLGPLSNNELVQLIRAKLEFSEERLISFLNEAANAYFGNKCIQYEIREIEKT